MSEENAEEVRPDDPTTWPPDLCAAWERCQLPSLHDFLLAQERLAMEVRRQNQELRRLGDRLASEPPTATPTAGSDPAAPLIAVADAVEHLRGGLDRALASLTAVLPARQGLFARPPAWRDRALDIVRAQGDGARLVVDRLADALADANISAVTPAPGTVFDPELHRAVATAAGTPGHILAVRRPGYRRDATVLRPAEVIVGHSDDSTTG